MKRVGRNYTPPYLSNRLNFTMTAPSQAHCASITFWLHFVVNQFIVSNLPWRRLHRPALYPTHFNIPAILIALCSWPRFVIGVYHYRPKLILKSKAILCHYFLHKSEKVRWKNYGMEDSRLQTNDQLLYLVIEPLIDYPSHNNLYTIWNAGINFTIFRVSVDNNAGKWKLQSLRRSFARFARILLAWDR